MLRAATSWRSLRASWATAARHSGRRASIFARRFPPGHPGRRRRRSRPKRWPESLFVINQGGFDLGGSGFDAQEICHCTDARLRHVAHLMLAVVNPLDDPLHVGRLGEGRGGLPPLADAADEMVLAGHVAAEPTDGKPRTGKQDLDSASLLTVSMAVKPRLPPHDRLRRRIIHMKEVGIHHFVTDCSRRPGELIIQIIVGSGHHLGDFDPCRSRRFSW